METLRLAETKFMASPTYMSMRLILDFFLMNDIPLQITRPTSMTKWELFWLTGLLMSIWSLNCSLKHCTLHWHWLTGWKKLSFLSHLICSQVSGSEGGDKIKASVGGSCGNALRFVLVSTSCFSPPPHLAPPCAGQAKESFCAFGTWKKSLWPGAKCQ